MLCNSLQPGTPLTIHSAIYYSDRSEFKAIELWMRGGSGRAEGMSGQRLRT